MNLVEAIGYLASGLVLTAFMMRTMIPLRLVGIASNVAFITYGYVAGLPPVMILHLILLPLNVFRLYEMVRLVREVEAAGIDGSLEWLLPFMRTISRPAGSVLFAKGDDADALYLLTEGRIRLEELGVEVEAGETIGEIGVFSTRGKRMATAVCVEPCHLQAIAREKVREIVFQNPRLSFHLIEVVTSRLLEDVRILEDRVAHLSPGR